MEEMDQSIVSLAIVIGEVAALLAIPVTLLVFIIQSRRESNLRKTDLYQELEFRSMEVFRFEAVHCASIDPFFEEFEIDPDQRIADLGTTAVNSYIFQCLNLFEIASTHRRRNTIDKHVYGSWVAWHYDLLKGWYFRRHWPEIRAHYTNELLKIFDGPVDEFRLETEDDERRRQFYTHVSKVTGCRCVEEWLHPEGAKPGKRRKSRPRDPEDDLLLEWELAGSSGDDLSSFMIGNVGADKSYISLGELAWGYSEDGRTWGGNMPLLMKNDISRVDDATVRNLVARTASGRICGYARTQFRETARVPHLYVEDIVIDVTYRSHGLGRRLMEAIEKRGKDLEASFIAFESGVNNHDAHRFFGRLGYSKISTNFFKDIR